MKTATSLAMVGTLFLAITVHAGPQAAQTPMDHGQMKMNHPDMKMPSTPETRAKMANTMFDRIDANKDGTLSRAEFVEHHRTMSMQPGGMHMHHHGTDAMHHGGKQHGMGHGGHAPTPASTSFQALDGNKDGKLSKAEMAKHPMAAHFAMMDTDGNGYVSPAEAAAHGL